MRGMSVNVDGKNSDKYEEAMVIGSIGGGIRRALSLGRWSSRLESCGLLMILLLQ